MKLFELAHLNEGTVVLLVEDPIIVNICVATVTSAIT